MEMGERYRGAMLGLASGDALGTTVEFMRPGSFEPVTDIVGGGPFGLPAGAWTDDTSMALCLAESLIERDGFEPVDQLERYVRWWRDGHLSATGTCFDIGVATGAALGRFEWTGEEYPGDANPEAAGNGALMRIAPVALAFANAPAAADRNAALASRTTHGSPKSSDACRYYAGLIIGALEGVSKADLIGGDVYRPEGSEALTDPQVLEVANGSFREKNPPEIRGRGYVVAALEAALWALHATDDFESGALAAVNVGDDADSTGAIYGQLAGAIYGVEAIPSGWLRKLVMREEITGYADRLFDLAEREGAK